MVTCSKLPSEDGSVISNESERLKPGRGSTALKVTVQQKPTKEETRKKDGESPESEKQAQVSPGLYCRETAAVIRDGPEEYA